MKSTLVIRHGKVLLTIFDKIEEPHLKKAEVSSEAILRMRLLFIKHRHFTSSLLILAQFLRQDEH